MATTADNASTVVLKGTMGFTPMGTGTVTMNAARIIQFNTNGSAGSTITNDFIISNSPYNNFKTESGNAIYLTGSFTGASNAAVDS